MINITKNGNVSVILFTDSDYYLFNSGQIIAPLGSLTMVVDSSDMVTFRKAANNDLLFSAKLGKITINGTLLSKQNAQSLFDAAMGGSGGSGIRFVEVQQLPTTGENGVIYLVPNGDTFVEYVWLEDEETFEKLGYDVDLSNYYNKAEIDDAHLTISAALNELHDEKQDLLNFDNSPTQNSTNPVTSGGVYTALQNVQPDLSNYYTKSEIDNAVENNELAIAAAVNDLNENKADKSEIPDLTDYATKTYVDDAIAEIPQPDMSNYYDKDDIDEGNRVVSTALNRLNNDIVELQSDIDTNYYTESEVDAALATKQNTLTFDSAPTQNSTNPVTSGGLYIVLGDIDTALATIIGSNS